MAVGIVEELKIGLGSRLSEPQRAPFQPDSDTRQISSCAREAAMAVAAAVLRRRRDEAAQQDDQDVELDEVNFTLARLREIMNGKQVAARGRVAGLGRSSRGPTLTEDCRGNRRGSLQVRVFNVESD